ncbi:MAG: 30S ribosomal protein S3 [Desulfurococcales archaeon]|nr:30S ribosomal protein S3 [Desulfurococcales archaeon]MCE4605392.1 30S ribosomal protein S3 [Desulfurococcales archaeon]
MSRIKKMFLKQSILKAKVDEYLAQNFYEAGYSGAFIIQSGLGTRVHIYAERPALIIGRRGATVRRLQDILSTVFDLENPQITVSQPDNPELDARIQAFRIARSIERGYHFRRVAFAALRRIMNNGAVGVEVTISGKLTSERARFEKYKAGKVYKAGQVVDELVDRAVAHAKLPKGIIGVEVIIVKPGVTPDYIRIKSPEEVRGFIESLREEMLEESLPEELKEMIEEVQEGGEA